MKTYQYRIDGRELRIRIDAQRGSVAGLELDGAVPYPQAADMGAYVAAICLALLEHDTAVMHDDETDVITLTQDKSSWANPADSMNERGSLLKNLLGW